LAGITRQIRVKNTNTGDEAAREFVLVKNTNTGPLIGVGEEHQRRPIKQIWK